MWNDRRFWITNGVIAALIAAFVCLAWVPCNNAIDQARTANQNARDELADFRQQSRGDGRLILQIRQLTHRLNGSGKTIPDADQMAAQVQSIRAMIEDYELADPEITVDPAVSENRVIRLPVTVRFVGDAMQAFALLHGLESQTQRIRVEHLSMQTTTPTGSQVAVTLKFEAYFIGTEGR